MTTKTITIMEDAYDLLFRNKLENESFSDVIRRTMSKKNNLMDCFGSLSEEYANAIHESIEKQRSFDKNQDKQSNERFFA